MAMACSVVVAAPLASCGVDPLGGRATPPRQPPGQTHLLEAPKQGKGWLFFDWKAPADRDKPKAYKLQRRNRPAGPWATVATAILTEATLVDYPETTEFEYRVIALNTSAQDEHSNRVMVAL